MFTVDVYICIAMALRDAVVQPYQFDPESDPEGEGPDSVATAGHFRMVSVSEYVT